MSSGRLTVDRSPDMSLGAMEERLQPASRLSSLTLEPLPP